MKDWKLKVKEKLDAAAIRDEFQQLSDRESRDISGDITISALTENDMKQVSYLGYKELGLIPWVVNEDHPYAAFVDGGFSFVTKKDDEVLGFILAYKCSTFGGYNYIYIDTFVVNSFAQGQGVGKMLFSQVRDLAHKQKIYSIKLATKRSIPDHEIYKHFGLRDEAEEYVHMESY